MKKVVRNTLNLLYKLGFKKIILKISKNKNLSDKIIKYFWEKGGYEHYKKLYLHYRDLLRKNNLSLKNKKILEIGSGDSIGAGYFFANEKYANWTGSDINRTPNNENLIIRQINEMDMIYPNLNKTKFVKMDICKHSARFNNKFDLILSNAVLEHISKSKIDLAIKNMYLYLKKGGIMIHEIDLRDHFNLKDPFDFYRYSEKEWEKLTRGSIFYTNRLRSSDFARIFIRNHFRIVSRDIFQKKNLPKNINSELKKYQKEDLLDTSVVLVLKKIR